MTVNIAAHTYSVTVNGTTVAENFVFRTEQVGVTRLDNLALTGSSGSYSVRHVSDFGYMRQGSHPLGALIRGSDGNIYGTAAKGGAHDLGTVYQVTPAGVLTKLVDFTGDGPSNKGSLPVAGLVEHGGYFYGTTSKGGGSDLGTVFRVSTAGALETVFDFSSDDIDSCPMSRLVLGNDGNLYGTTYGSGAGAGSVYRLVFDGPPAVYPLTPPVKVFDSAMVRCKFNPKGAATSAWVEYGTDGVVFPRSVPVSSYVGAGYRTVELGATLANLERDITYYYRFGSNNSRGTRYGAVLSFKTIGVPQIATNEATNIQRDSAMLHGIASARNSETTVVFEYGVDGIAFPFRALSVPGTLTGSGNQTVATQIAGLEKNTTYYYRIVAANEAGTAQSGMMSFTTLAEPIATIGGAVKLSTIKGQVNGAVNARGSDSHVEFEYGTDGVNFPDRLDATPALVVGGGDTAVTAILNNLRQGTKYYYRIKAASAGGDDASDIENFTLDLLSGLDQMLPLVRQQALGSLRVDLAPSGIDSGWRIVGEKQWRTPGEALGGLATGDRLIEFKPVPGFIPPPQERVSVIGGGGETVFAAQYFETDEGITGGLSVILKPDNLTASGLPVDQRAQWRFLGEGDNDWRDSASASLSGLPPGNYLVECKPVVWPGSTPQWTTPEISNIIVRELQTAALTITYSLAGTSVGVAPLMVPPEDVANDAGGAYAFTGQIRSDLGMGSGFVVKPKVVATAGHVVFDDASLAAVTGLQWLFQRDAGTYEPKPQIPRGYYLFDGYATARSELGVVPGEGTSRSQHYDAAALYFLEDAGRGGAGGYLASESGTNEHLDSAFMKRLTGYPVDGVAASEQGRLFATPPMNAVFSRVPGDVTPGVSYRTYTTPDIRGYGGMSGGPLCIEQPNGHYYPAGIYLGGSGQTVVRSIDREVVDLFNRAEVSGNGGDDHTGGGITHTSVLSIGSSPGILEFRIEPAAARNGGAGWRIKPEIPYRTVDQIKPGLSAGRYVIQFKSVDGFQTPTQVTVQINRGEHRIITYQYALDVPPPAITSAKSVAGTRGQALAYQIVATNSPGSYGLTGSLPGGLSLNTGSGRISGTLQEAGVFIVTLSATNAGGSGTKALSITSRPSVANQSKTTALGQPMSHQIQSSESGADVSYGATGLPQGLDVNEETGVISGSPTESGVFTSLLTVTKDGASSSAILTLTVTATPLDIWRFAKFGTTSNTGPAADSADPDGDGQNNLSEYAAGTEPKDATDVFRILTTAKTGSTFTVTAQGMSGRVYTLRRRADLASGSWGPVSPPATVGPLTADRQTVTLTDPAAPAGGSFYRIQVSMP